MGRTYCSLILCVCGAKEEGIGCAVCGDAYNRVAGRRCLAGAKTCLDPNTVATMACLDAIQPCLDKGKTARKGKRE